MNKVQRITFFIIIIYCILASITVIYLASRGLVAKIPFYSQIGLFTALGSFLITILFLRRFIQIEKSNLYLRLGYKYGVFQSILFTIGGLIMWCVGSNEGIINISKILILTFIYFVVFISGNIFYLVRMNRVKPK